MIEVLREYSLDNNILIDNYYKYQKNNELRKDIVGDKR